MDIGSGVDAGLGVRYRIQYNKILVLNTDKRDTSYNKLARKEAKRDIKISI